MPSIPPLDPNFETSIEELCKPLPKKKRFSKRFFLILIPIVAIFILIVSRNHEVSKPLVFLKGPCPDFVGRKEILDILYQDLLQGKTKKEYQHSALTKVLRGMGGYGKSEIAIEFANRYLSQFSLIWTFYCDSQEHIDQGYRLLAQKLGLLNPAESLEKVKERVHFYLENDAHSLPWLLIYDNVEEEFTDLPQRGGVVLITSQKKILNPEYLLEVTPFKKNEAIQLLEKITGESQTPIMEELVNDLEGIPLLLNYAAHYIKATPGCGIDDYQQIFLSNLHLYNTGDVNQRYLKSLATSWQFPLKALENKNPVALKWLYVCSYLSPEYIPEYWIDGNPSSKKEILSALRNFGIIRYDAETKTFSIHRFFQYMIRESRKNNIEEDLTQAVELLSNHAKDYKFSELSTWATGRLWYLHACEVVKWFEKLNSKTMKLSEALLFDGIGEWCSFNSRYSEAVRTQEKALDLRLSVLPPNDHSIGNNYVCLAWSLINSSRFKEALEPAEKGEEILKNGSFLDFAEALHIKAMVLRCLGRVEEAIEYNLKALSIRLEEMGIFESDFEQVNKKRKEVIALRELNRSHEALLLHEKIVDIGRSLGNLGLCFHKIGKHQIAAKYFENCASIYEYNCGKTHPLFSRSLRSRAWNSLEQGQYDLAQKFFEQAITLQQKDSVEIAYTYSGLGWCFVYKGDFKQALRYFKKTRSLLKHHPDEYLFLQAKEKFFRGMGLCYLKCGRIEKGLKYLVKQLRRAKELYANTPNMLLYLDEFHTDLKTAHSATLEQLQKAATVGYQISLETLGEGHPITKDLHNFLTQNYT